MQLLGQLIGAGVFTALVTGLIGLAIARAQRSGVIGAAKAAALAEVQAKREEVDERAFARAEAIYVGAIATAHDQAERLHGQLRDALEDLDRASAHAEAQDAEILRLQQEVSRLSTEVARLQGELAVATTALRLKYPDET